MESKKSLAQEKIFFIIIFIYIFSCKNDDYIDEYKQGKFLVSTEYRLGKKQKSKIFDEQGILLQEFLYDKDSIISEIKEYYPNNNIKVKYSFVKENNDYYVETFYENGILSSEGVVDLIRKENGFYPLHKEGWIYYGNNKEPYNMSIFMNNGKNVFILRKTILDTIDKTKIIEDRQYNPPIKIDLFYDDNKLGSLSNPIVE